MEHKIIIYSYKNKNAAKKFIGKMVIISDNLYNITEEPEHCCIAKLENIVKTKNNYDYPFRTNGGDYQFIREL